MHTVSIVVRERGFRRILRAQTGGCFHVRHPIFEASAFGVLHESGEWNIEPQPQAVTKPRCRMSSVDVVVPCYNYARYLRACVGSILSQRDVDVRVLIVDRQVHAMTAPRGPGAGRIRCARDLPSP